MCQIVANPSHSCHRQAVLGLETENPNGFEICPISHCRSMHGCFPPSAVFMKHKLTILLCSLVWAGHAASTGGVGVRGLAGGSGVDVGGFSGHRHLSALQRSDVFCTQPEHLGKIHVHVVRAAGLANQDLGLDESDAHATVQWGGQSVDLESTRANTLNPSWAPSILASFCVSLPQASLTSLSPGGNHGATVRPPPRCLRPKPRIPCE